MDQTRFRIVHMDCTAEETLVRMKLDPIEAVKALEFNLSQRELTIFHTGELPLIAQALDELHLGATLVTTAAADAAVPAQTVQRTILWTVLLINATFFGIELLTGLLARSMGLIADSLDMLADALVYALSLVAVGTTTRRKKQVARWSGYFQLSLAVLGLLEVLRRSLGLAALPDYRIMIGVALFALCANVLCLYLLQRARSGEAHMQASMIFTSNDIIMNLGVIAAGLFVSWLHSGIPDLIIGTLVFLLVTRGALRILNLAT